MEYQVKITASASRAAKKFHPEIRQAARAALRKLAENPFSSKPLQAELRGFRSCRFLRYRIVFKVDIEMKVITVWAIGHRRDIYETMGEHFLKHG